jgi:predicted nuclease with TOPRIM domain
MFCFDLFRMIEDLRANVNMLVDEESSLQRTHDEVFQRSVSLDEISADLSGERADLEASLRASSRVLRAAADEAEHTRDACALLAGLAADQAAWSRAAAAQLSSAQEQRQAMQQRHDELRTELRSLVEAEAADRDRRRRRRVTDDAYDDADVDGVPAEVCSAVSAAAEQLRRVRALDDALAELEAQRSALRAEAVASSRALADMLVEVGAELDAKDAVLASMRDEKAALVRRKERAEEDEDRLAARMHELREEERKHMYAHISC